MGSGSITYNNNVVTLSGKNVWQHAVILQYDITEADIPDISITNTYTPNTTTLTVTKTVTGNMGDTSKYFDFTLTLVKDNINYTEALEARYSAATDRSTLGVTTDTASYSFSLASGQSIEITVPVGYAYTITEDDYSGEGYTTKIGETETRESKGEIGSDAITITYVNDKTVGAPTGLNRDVAPYVAALAIALGGAVLMFVSRRRRV